MPRLYRVNRINWNESNKSATKHADWFRIDWKKIHITLSDENLIFCFNRNIFTLRSGWRLWIHSQEDWLINTYMAKVQLPLTNWHKKDVAFRSSNGIEPKWGKMVVINCNNNNNNKINSGLQNDIGPDVNVFHFDNLLWFDKLWRAETKTVGWMTPTVNTAENSKINYFLRRK